MSDKDERQLYIKIDPSYPWIFSNLFTTITRSIIIALLVIHTYFPQNRYVTRSSRKGHIIIINNMDFRETRRYGQPGLEDRPGSEKDEKRLIETFTGFGFVCQPERNQKGLVCLHWRTGEGVTPQRLIFQVVKIACFLQWCMKSFCGNLSRYDYRMASVI